MKKLIALLMFSATLVAQTQDGTNNKKWPIKCKKVEIISTLDKEIQMAYFYSSNEKKRPLVISLHTWSGNYEQKDDLVIQCIENEYNYIHLDFRGPNNTFKHVAANTYYRTLKMPFLLL